MLLKPQIEIADAVADRSFADENIRRTESALSPLPKKGTAHPDVLGRHWLFDGWSRVV